jgi:CcmD family protein
MGSLMPVLERTAGQRVVADFVVMGVILLVWAGVFFYLFRLDRKVKALLKKDKAGLMDRERKS